MPLVSQFTPDLVGGVSTQADVKKFSNQVVEAKNVMVDPSFGLCKRTGSNFLKTLGTEDDFKDAAFFFYRRDDDEFYLVAVQKNSVRVFNIEPRNLKEVTVTGRDGGPVDFSYLNSDNYKDYRSLTIQDNSVIVNRQQVTAMLSASEFLANRIGTVVIRSVEYAQVYSVTINGVTSSTKTRNSDDIEQETPFLNANEILGELKTKIEADNEGVEVVQYETSLEITFTDNREITIDAEGGVTGEALIAFTDSVRDITWVPNTASDGRTVKVENTTADDDDYYIAYNASTKSWEETNKPGIETKFDPSTMPHELVSTAKDAFEFRAIDWKERFVGDDKTNPLPSFVGKRINGLFLTNNRLAFLSGPNVIMSVSSDYYNFFARSATTVIASDPIDINCNSTIPTNLTYALSIPAGVMLYSDRQQFLLTADSKIYTPESTFIRQVSNYELDNDIEAVDLGTYQAIVSKTMNSSRVMFMQINDINEPPAVAEISKVVSGYIPVTVDNIVSSSENDMIMLSDRSSKDVILFRRFNTGSRDVLQSWFKWELPGQVLDMFIANDMVFVISIQEEQTTLFQIDINQNKAHQTMYGSDSWANVALDFRFTPFVKAYKSDTNRTRMYPSYKPIDGLQAMCVDVLTEKSETETSGYYLHELDRGTDEIGPYFEFMGDLTAKNVVVGLRFGMEVVFPEIFYRSERVTDYSAYLNIARMKFSVGLSGALAFQISAKGREEWKPIEPVIETDYYMSDMAPLVDRFFFNVPIHQRSSNFRIKAYSDLPYPVCLNMFSWEGHYVPKYYRRS